MFRFNEPFISELLIADSPFFKPEDFKKLDIIENNLESLVKKYGKENERVWELCRKVLWTYITASAELIRTSHTDDSKYFISKGIQLLDPKAGIIPARPEEGEFFKFSLIVNIACCNVMRRENASSVKSLQQVIDLKPSVRAEYVGTYCLEFAYYFLGVICYEQNSLDSSETYFRTFMLLLNSCQSYIKHKNQKKRLNHYLAKCYTYFFLGKIFMNKDEDKAFKYTEKAYLMSGKIDRLNIFVKQMIDQEYSKFKLRREEVKNDPMPNYKDQADKVNKKYLAKLGPDEPGTIKSSKDRLEKLRRDGSLTVSLEAKTPNYQNNGGRIVLEPSLNTEKALNGAPIIRIKSSMGRKLSIPNLGKDSPISEEPKEVSIDSNVIDVIQKIEDSTFEMKHKRIEKRSGTQSNLESEFEELLVKDEEEKKSRNDVSSEVLNKSVSFLGPDSNQGNEQNPLEEFIKFHKRAKSMATNKMPVQNSGRQDSFSIIEKAAPQLERLPSITVNKQSQKKQIVPMGMSIIEMRRLEVQAANLIKKNWKIHKSRPKKEPVKPPKIQNLLELGGVVNSVSDLTYNSKTIENRSQNAIENTQLGVPIMDREISHSLSAVDRNDHQLKPMPSILHKIDFMGSEMKHPPVTPTSLVNDSFGNLEDKRAESRANLGLRSRKDFVIKSDQKLLMPEFPSASDIGNASPQKSQGNSNIIDEVVPTFDPEKEKLAIASQLTLDGEMRKERRVSKGPDKLELNMSLVNKMEEAEDHLVSSPDRLKIDLANHNPELAPKHNQVSFSPHHEPPEKKTGKQKETDKNLQVVNKKALSILNTVKSTQAAEKHNPTPFSVSPKSVNQSNVSGQEQKEKKPAESFGGMMKMMGHVRESQDVSAQTSNDNSRIDATQADGKILERAFSKAKLRQGGTKKGSMIGKSFKKGGGTGVSFNSVLRGSQPIEKAPMFEIEEDQNVIKLKLMPFRFSKTMQNQNCLWKVRFISKIHNKINDTSFFRFEIRNRQDISLQFQVPVVQEDEPKNEEAKNEQVKNEKAKNDKATTIWPRVLSGFTQWFIGENLEEFYRQHEQKTHWFVKEKILMSRRKSVVGNVDQERMTPKDQEALIKMKRRLCFLIEKKLFIQRKQNGPVLCIARNVEDQVLREFLSYEMKTAEVFYKEQKNKLLGLPPEDHSVGDLTPLHSARNRASSEKGQKTPKKLLIQTVIFNQIWYLVQVYLEDAYKSSLNNRDSVSIVVTPLTLVSKPPRKDSRVPLRKEFHIPLRVFVENLRRYWLSSYISFYYTKHLTLTPIIRFISNINKIVVFTTVKDNVEVSLSSDYLPQEVDDFDYSFRENRALDINEAFHDNARSKKKKKLTAKGADSLFHKNYVEVFEKYFSSKKEMVFNQNIEAENKAHENIKVGDEETEDTEKAGIVSEEPSFSKEVKNRKSTESFLSAETPRGTGSLLKKRRYYLSYRIDNLSVVYLRIESKKGSWFNPDSEYMVVSGYHPFKGHLYYKQITSQKMIERIKNIIIAEKAEKTKTFALMDLVKNELNLTGRSFNIKNINYDIQSIQKKNQMSLHPTFLKVALLKNSPCLLNTFKCYRYFFLHEIATVGRTYVEMNVYCWNLQIPTDHEIHLSFDIHPVETKTKQYKLILNDSDVLNFFGVQIRHEFNSHYLIDLARTMLSKFKFHRHMISKRLKIESNRTVYKEFDRKVYTLENNLNPNNFDNNLKVSHYLEPKYYQPKIILQQVKRYQKTFFIFTIEHSQPFDFWNIRIYNPRSSRTFLVTINFNDILSWRSRFYEKVYPAMMDEMDLNEIKDYQHYMMRLKALKGRARGMQSARKKTALPGLNEEILSKEDRRTLHKMERMYGTHFLTHHLNHGDEAKQQSNWFRLKAGQLESKYITNEIAKKLDFHEIRFWQNVTELCEFRSDNRGNTCIRINNFAGELKEIVFGETVKIDKYTDTLIEMYHEKSGANIDLFGVFDNISYLSSINYSMLIKIYYFRNLHYQFERMNLREIINLFIADGFYKYQANYFESKVNLADLKIICDYIVFKIKNSNLVNLMHETPLFSRKFIHDIGDESKKSDHPSLMMEDENAKVFLTKEILTVNPPRAVTLWYKNKKGLVEVKIYSLVNSSVIELILKIRKLRKQIPMIEPMLANKMYRDVGRRILAHGRTFLTMYAGYRDRMKKDAF